MSLVQITKQISESNGLKTPNFLMAVSMVAVFVRPEGKIPNNFLISTYMHVQGIQWLPLTLYT